MPALTAVDLFCGAGGFTEGLRQSGFDVLVGVDNWDAALRTYRLNHSHLTLDMDVGSLKGPGVFDLLGVETGSIDLLVGGPPCQGFSVQRIGRDSDVRNSLVLDFARLIAELRPSLFIMENVPGLRGKRGAELLKAFAAACESGGYRVDVQTANAAEYGLPQVRRRVFVTGQPMHLPLFHIPEPTLGADNFVSVMEAIGDLPSPPADRSPLAGDVLHRRTRLSELNQRRIELIPPGGGMEDLPEDMRVDCHKAGAAHIGHRYVYGRLAPDKPSSTITARFDSFTRGRFGHPVEPRNITLREGARLQSFPDSYRFVGTQAEIAAQIGNAVPPAMAEKMGAAAVRYLTRVKDPRPRSRCPDDNGAQLRLEGVVGAWDAAR